MASRAWLVWLRKIATYDFFPQFSARVRRMLYSPLCVLSTAALMALVFGLTIQPRVLVLCISLTAVIVIGLCWPWLTLRGVEVSVGHDRDRAAEGETVEITISLTNRLPWPVWGLILRSGYQEPDITPTKRLPWLSSNLPGPTGTEIPLSTVAGRACSLQVWKFTPSKRGRYPRRECRVVTGVPFGVWEASKKVQSLRPLTVWPRTFPVGPVPWMEDESLVEGNVARKQVGNNGDMLGVRPYRRGDSPRRIHWGQSARHDRLIVCELQASHRPLIQLVVDTHPASHSGTGPESSLEWAIRIAASFAKGWLEAGVLVGLVAHNIAVPALAGRTQIDKLLDALACLPEDRGTPLRELLASSACRLFRGGLQVVITTDREWCNWPLLPQRGQRWVVLSWAGFAATATSSCGPGTGKKPWLWIPSAQEIPHLLRHGWAEARHGS